MHTRADVLKIARPNTTKILHAAAGTSGGRLAAMWFELQGFTPAAPVACAYARELADCLDRIGQVRFADWEALKLLAGARAPKLEAAE